MFCNYPTPSYVLFAKCGRRHWERQIVAGTLAKAEAVRDDLVGLLDTASRGSWRYAIIPVTDPNTTQPHMKNLPLAHREEVGA